MTSASPRLCQSRGFKTSPKWHQCDVPAGLRDAKAIAASQEYTVALKKDGTTIARGRFREVARFAAERDPQTDPDSDAAEGGDFSFRLFVAKSDDAKK
jgi:hypothetical protein